MALRLSHAIVLVVVFLAVAVICLMVKFATEISVHPPPPPGPAAPALRSLALVSLGAGAAAAAARYPYLVAVLRSDNVSWLYACTGSLIMHRWIVTSAHCQGPGAHQVLLYHDFAKSFGRNATNTYSALVWKTHPAFRRPDNDIAVVKLAVRKYDVKRAFVDIKMHGWGVQASVWKSVTASDGSQHLTDEVADYALALAPRARCEGPLGARLAPGALCVDLRGHEDCFAGEFGPLFSDNQLVGVLALPPPTCAARWAVFTNVSHHASWIRAMTKDMR